MDQPVNELLNELNTHPEYPRLFKNLYKRDTIDSIMVGKVMAQFLRALVSAKTPQDSLVDYLHKNGSKNIFSDTFKGYSPKALKALKLCGVCHDKTLYGGSLMKNNGLELLPTDVGLAKFSQKEGDIGLFKAVTLRNVELTPPYMHDGRFKTLAEVIEHYNSGIQAHPNLDSILMENGKPIRLRLNKKDKKDILRFLKNMTDWKFVQDTSFAPSLP